MGDVKWYLGGGGAAPTFWICSRACIADSPDDVDLVDDCILVTPDKGARCGNCDRVAVFDFPIEGKNDGSGNIKEDA